ncbi:MAG: hypothetical protein P4L87_26270 [Formivibrio sp.]|nr:hypothetical protein [Formivibrio sp.]
MQIGIVSGSDDPHLKSQTNHQFYARLHGYAYEFDTSRYWWLQTPHFRKLRTVQKALSEHDWTFWIDDDAFFTQMELPLERLLQDVPDDVFLIICSSPVSPDGKHTFVSSGQFLIKNCPTSAEFIRRVLATSVRSARKWWDPAIYGSFTNGDQDAIVYRLVTDGLLARVKIYPYQAFNCRTYHYDKSLNEHFLVHFAGVPDKAVAVREFATRFGVDETLLPSPQHYRERA